MPQVAGVRKCSLKAKGWPIDKFLADATGSRPYLHAMGYEAGETGRARRDATYDTEVRTGIYPLITWGWDRAACGSAAIRSRTACLRTLSWGHDTPFQPGPRTQPGDVRDRQAGDSARGLAPGPCCHPGVAGCGSEQAGAAARTNGRPRL